jgi:superfamily II DNA or RNA helicase
VDHARQVRGLYEECGFKAKEIHSQMDSDEQEAVLGELQQGRLDCIVQVQMLGEGFDHPRLSIAAIFRPFRSLSPYIQFVGRAMRVIHENQAGHADNQAFIISHVGLNNDERWEDFKELDLEDQLAFHDWLTTEGQDDEGEGSGSGQPRRFDQGMLVDGEVVSHFIDQTFLDPSDDRVLDQLLEKEIAPGIPLRQLVSRDRLREQLRERLRAHQPPAEERPEAVPVTPQRRRRTTKKRLDERTKSVAARVLRDLKLSPAGRDIGKAIPKGRGLPNRQALFKLLNSDVNEALKIGSRQRNEPTGDDLVTVFNQLDQLGDALRDRIRAVLERKSSA